MDKLLTLVIPTYNMEKYLRRCLDSLIIDDKELFDHLEVLVINDGSKDSSSAIAHDYQDKYPNVFRVIDKENGNYGSCVNRGLKEASGKYIKILDSDDYFNKEAFSGYLDCLMSTDVDLVITDFVQVNGNGNRINTITYDIPHGVKTDVSLCNVKKLNRLEMHGITYRKKILIDMDYRQTEGISYTDQEWSLIPFSSVTTMYYYPFVIYMYFIGRNDQTVSFQQMANKLEDFEIVFKRLLANDVRQNSGWLKTYKEERLLGLINIIYKILFFKFDEVSIRKVKEFDSFIRLEDGHFYYLMNDIFLNKRFCRIKYVKLFRRKRLQRLKWSLLYYRLFLVVRKGALKLSSFL